jgi:hypothetical protein
MNRGDMRTELRELIEDLNSTSFEDARLDRALNRAARFWHSRVATMASTSNYARGRVEFTPSTSALTHALSTTSDMASPRYMRRTDLDYTGVLGRGLLPSETAEFACIIPESQRSHPDYEYGLTMDGRQIVFFTYDGSSAYPWTVNWICAPSGTWELIYNKTFTELTVDDTPTDSSSYETVPEFAHMLVVYWAAISILGIHKEDQSPIVMEYKGMQGVFETQLKRATATGAVRDVR